MGDNAALGTGTVTFSGGRISSDSVTARALANKLAMSGTLILGDAVNTGTLAFSGDVALTADTVLTVASGVTLGGVVSGSFGLVKDGSGTLNLGGSNTFTGSLNVSGGFLTLSGGGALADSVILTLQSSGSLRLSDSEVIGGLAGAGSVDLQSNTLTVSGGADTVFRGAIDGAGAFTCSACSN